MTLQDIKVSLQNSLDQIIEGINRPVLAEYLLISYAEAIIAEKGYGGTFKIAEIYELAKNLNYSPALPFKLQFQSGRARLEEEFGLFAAKEGQTTKDKSRGYEYLLPKDEAEMQKIKEWYTQKNIPNRSAKNMVVGITAQRPPFSSNEYDLFVGAEEWDGKNTVVRFYKANRLNYLINHENDFIYVAFSKKGDEPLEGREFDISDFEAIDFHDGTKESTKKRLDYSRATIKKEISPIYFIADRGSAVQLVRAISDYGLKAEEGNWVNTHNDL
ncbi:MAG: hypothetical protein NDI94_02870 [Candidatus Woesearchaeota archaeon]|nr:hypothetical protein [Candidatus Woesearchaeota archaeon]